MKFRPRRVIYIIVALVVVYFAVPFPFLSVGGRDDVRESAIRWLLHHNDSGQQKKIQVCFIGIGKSFDLKEQDSSHDPTKEFVARFADFPVPVLPLSAKTNVINSGGIPFVTDTTGKHGIIFYAGNVRRWSMGLVVCRGCYYVGGINAAGYEIYILRVPFAWIPVCARMLWIS